MTEQRIKISSIIKNQLPEYVKEEFPLASEFLSQYYISQESQGSSYDIIQNIDKYIKIDNVSNLIESTTLSTEVDFFDTEIQVDSTAGFPSEYGLLKIDDEIITYTGITTNTFTGCVRGFSGVSSLKDSQKIDQLVFSTTDANSHSVGTIVENLSILFLKEFYKKIKIQLVPGLEDQEFYEGLNESLFVKQSKDFYSSKGTDSSFKILFSALYGKVVDVIKPRDYLIQPSDAQYRIFKKLIVEPVEGDPTNLVNTLLFQDQGYFEEANGTISKVEKVLKNSKEYFILSLDYDYNRDISVRGTTRGEFSIHPKTTLTSNISLNSNFIDVDSTVGFPSSGELVVNVGNDQILIQYQSKSINQFFGCSGITNNIPKTTEIKLNEYAYGYYGNNQDQIVKVRITGVIQDLNIVDKNNSILYQKNNSIEIETLGEEVKDIRANSWIFNIPVRYNIKSINASDASTYLVELYDEHSFAVGDDFILNEVSGKVSSIVNQNSITINPNSIIDIESANTIEKQLLKVNSVNYSNINICNANVINSYTDLNDSYYVASPSLPNYLNAQLSVKDGTINISSIEISGEEINLNQDHFFYTGDCVVFKSSTTNNSNILDGVYYVKEISSSIIKLARSRENIFSENYIEIVGTLSGSISFFEFNDLSLNIKQLDNQKLLRKITDPLEEFEPIPTNYGFTGILANGVELLNYKSKDKVFYGPIEDIIVTSSGNGYDIINPPQISITDQIGVGASAYCTVTGGLERIDIIDPGFDYIEIPKISITGGNGNGAIAEVNLVQFDHAAELNSENSTLLNFTQKIIGFSTYHRFKDYEEVIYVTQGQTAISGLNTNSTYIVKKITDTSIKLYKSTSDAISGINTINFTSIGSGVHSFKSTKKKKRIGTISIVNSGAGYSNKKRIAFPIGINTASDTIVIKNHGYESGEIIRYDSTDIPISGLSSSTEYYVKKIDDNQFKLYQTSNNSNNKDYFYKTDQFINLESVGSGKHIFNYPPIQVSVLGAIGIATTSGQDFYAKVNPVFRGKIESVFVEDGGNNYGSEEIINYNRQPTIDLITGSSAEIIPIVSKNGSIVDVIIQSSGYNYEGIPDIVVNGDGIGAVLVPVISLGKITKINIISGGGGYSQDNTFIQVIPAGREAKFESKTKSWEINLVERIKDSNRISDDEGIIAVGINPNYGLQYSHLYLPLKLRSSLYSKNNVSGQTYFIPDIENDNESNTKYHSPLVGWAYDGNPIYGPYGYSSPKQISPIKALVSGYREKDGPELSLEGRPSFNLYRSGFFINDYKFDYTGDLDENNGRFCITPEYPNGTYAYFSTLNEDKEPQFPYVIGNSYKSKPIEFNFKSTSNQDNINLNQMNWIRNTKPYNLTKNYSGYDYIFNNNPDNSKIATISNVLSGSISSIEIINSGSDYQVDDKIIFNNEGTEGRSAYAFVSEIEGKAVSQISVASTFFDNTEFIPSPKDNTKLLGFTSVPHNLNNNDIISITGDLEYNKNSTIKIANNTLILTTSIASTTNTGIVTYFNISGALDFPYIRENDVYSIGSEHIKILSVDKKSSRIKVIRNIQNITGITSYSSGSLLTENPRKFELSLDISSSFYNYKTNRELYFDPKETLSKGVSGITSTIYFSNPGVGETYVVSPIKTLYLPNHNLNTGEEITYSNNGGTSISVSIDGSSSYQLQNNSNIYVVKINNDLIGLSTTRVAIGSEGNLVGIGTTTANTLFFTGNGTGQYHSIKTNYDGILSARISNNVITVNTDSPHGLLPEDNISLDIISGLTTTVYVKYNDHNRRLVVNPKNIEEISTENNTLKITNHGYSTGDKVIYTSLSPIGGLISNKIYYIVVISENIIKLSNSLYNSTKKDPIVIEFSSSGTGTLSQINPIVRGIKGQTIIFNLSDPSLSYTTNSIKSAFDFNLFEDSNLINKLEFVNSQVSQEITKSGVIGVDNSANLTVKLTSNLPEKIYYGLVPINLEDNLAVKKEIIVDYEQKDNNLISKINSVYSGDHTVSEISSQSFKYNLNTTSSEFNSTYTVNNSEITYTTTSKSAFGGIESIKIENVGKDYKKVPYVESIESEYGKNAKFNIISTNIGAINKVELKNIGYDYYSDLTIRPKAKIPQIFEIDSLFVFDSVGIITTGSNYTSSPDLLVIDESTGEQIPDVKLQYSISSKKVTIIKNTNGIRSESIKIIPVNNSNGIGINSIFYDENTKDVTLTLPGTFLSSSLFPFEVGDDIFIENVNVISGKGYNSEDYNYSSFKITSLGINVGVTTNPTITYNMSSYLNSEEIPGVYDDAFIKGSVVAIKNVVSFNPVLKKFPFLSGEKIYSENEKLSGIVDKWDDNKSYLYVLTNDIFSEGDTIIGNSSNTVGRILDIKKVNSAFFNITSSSVAKDGWELETGFLNNDLQRIHDNDYYQYFSYSLKSEIEYEKWNEIVSNLNHTAGFKKFSNLLINSSLPGISSEGIPITFDSLSNSFVDIESFADVNCRTDFDFASESSVKFNNEYRSNQIYMKNVLLKDYFEMLGNRVILLDDISQNFDYSSQSFDITSDSIPVFKREFVGAAISITDNTIQIPNNFYVTGEEIEYRYPEDGTPIGITTTNIVGIGTTDILPNKIYIVKDNDFSVRVSSSASDALLTIPNVLEISNVGTGTTHIFVSKKQNSKSLITIDNIVQSPVVSTAITSITSSLVGINTNIIPIVGILSVSSGNYIKINDEFMKVLSLSGSDLEVTRNTLGSALTSHNSGSLVSKINGNYNIVDNTLYFVEPPIGDTPVESLLPDELDFSGITTSSSFTGRVFIRSGIISSNYDPYYGNYIFDDISDNFDGIEKNFTLKSNSQNIVGISTGNAIITLNGIVQGPNGFNFTGDFFLEENIGVTTISFTGTSSSVSYDVNNSSVPIGGVIISAGSTQGFGYQPLVSAGGTAIVSISGTIQSISIGNSGSGYRQIQTVRVAVKSNQNINYVGIASINNGNIVGVSITNPGVGYTSTNPPIVIFDSPLSYSNIPLIYDSSSSGVGTESKVNLIVDQDSKVLSFEFTNLGYGYKSGQVLTIPTGGVSGIPTNTGIFDKFKIFIERTYSDEFSGWYFGDLKAFDPLDRFFNGFRKSFILRENNVPKTITSKAGSNLIPQNAILIFINDVLQIPGKNYTFDGSIITFDEAPREGDNSKVLFYQGTSSVDILEKDVEETIKIGDGVTLFDDNLQFSENERTVFDIKSPVILETNTYPGPGINTDDSYLRPLTWCLQDEDKIIQGQEVSKGRQIYEPKIYPVTNIISNVGISTDQIFVEGVKTFFDSENEGPTYEIIIQSQDDITPVSTELITDVEYEGDFGYITGVSTTTFGGSSALVFDFYIPQNSYLRDPSIVGTPIIEESGISVGYYFVVSNSNVGSITTSKTISGSTIGISSYIDNVYQVASVSIGQTNVPGSVGLVDVAKVIVKADYSGLTGIGYSGFYGNYSWGRIHDFKRKTPKEFSAYNLSGYSGIQTSPLVYRYSPLKYQDYLS